MIPAKPAALAVTIATVAYGFSFINVWALSFYEEAHAPAFSYALETPLPIVFPTSSYLPWTFLAASPAFPNNSFPLSLTISV
jgi:hypothetical protein